MDARRRKMIALAAASLWPGLARTQAPVRRPLVVFIPTVGHARMMEIRDAFLATSADMEAARRRHAFMQSAATIFADQGLVIGRDLLFEYADLDVGSGDPANVERRARVVVARQPDVIIVDEEGVNLFKRLTRTIPLVFYSHSGDPVAGGLVEGYGHPGGNITGTTIVGPESQFYTMGWQLLKEIVPKAKRIGVLWFEEDVAGPDAPAEREREKAEAGKLGLQWVPVVVPEKTGIASIEKAIRDARVDLFDATNDPNAAWAKDLMRLVERMRLPTLWIHAGRVREGGLISASGSNNEAMIDAYGMAVKILRGTKPADIPVQTPKIYVIALNMRTARAMGLTVPQSVVVRATTVVDK